jgi:hypothetical protein
MDDLDISDLDDDDDGDDGKPLCDKLCGKLCHKSQIPSVRCAEDVVC